jgi:hypothetical protein
MKLIVFQGCHCADDVPTGITGQNMIDACASYGADCAVGFYEDIYLGETYYETWSVNFWATLYDGHTVNQALEAAELAVFNASGNYGGYDSHRVAGDGSSPGNIVIYPVSFGN